MRDPKMNGLHVVAFNAFATYEILLSWSTLFAIYTSSIWSTFLRIRYVNMALQIFRLSVPVAEHTQCLQKFMQNHSPITLNRSMLHRLAVACSIVGIQLKVQNFSCFSVVLHFVMLVRFAGWRGAGANTLHTITSTCKWQNCRCCRATWSGSCNRQSTYPTYFNGPAQSLIPSTQHDGCILFRFRAEHCFSENTLSLSIRRHSRWVFIHQIFAWTWKFSCNRHKIFSRGFFNMKNMQMDCCIFNIRIWCKPHHQLLHSIPKPITHDLLNRVAFYTVHEYNLDRYWKLKRAAATRRRL